MKNISNNYPEWNATGSEPDQSKKDEGWQPGEKPPADWFNWKDNKGYQSFQDIDDGIARRLSDVLTEGVLTGGAVTENNPADLNVLVEPLTGFNTNGARINLGSTQTVDLSTYLPTTVGNEKYVSVYVDVIDLETNTEINIVEGTPATAGSATKPDIDSNQGVLLADVLLAEGQTTILNVDIGEVRKQKIHLNNIAGQMDYVNVKDFGASSNKTNQENKNILQRTIESLNDGTGGMIIIPKDINYGYVRTDITTHPDLENLISGTNIVIMDMSIGNSYSLPSYDGMQIRWWFSTYNNELGMHDSNGHWIRGKANPHIFLQNDTDNLYSRRATIFFGTRGSTNWGIGQGTDSKTTHVNNVGGYSAGATQITVDDASVAQPYSGDSKRTANFRYHDTEYTATYIDSTTIELEPALTDSVEDNEFIWFSTTTNDDTDLEKFKIIGTPEDTGGVLANMVIITKDSGQFGFRTKPQYDYDFKAYRGTFRIKNNDNTDNLTIFLSHDDEYRELVFRGDTKNIEIRNRDRSIALLIKDNGNVKASSGISGGAFSTANRPPYSELEPGTMIFDTDLGKPIWWNENTSVWVDATGATV